MKERVLKFLDSLAGTVFVIGSALAIIEVFLLYALNWISIVFIFAAFLTGNYNLMFLAGILFIAIFIWRELESIHSHWHKQKRKEKIQGMALSMKGIKSLDEMLNEIRKFSEDEELGGR